MDEILRLKSDATRVKPKWWTACSRKYENTSLNSYEFKFSLN